MFPIVAIGASAGGLEAVSELLAALPSRTAMAFVLVQHLDPDHESFLVEILAKKTALRVVQAQSGQVVERDHVYVIPPNAELTLDDGRLRLTPRASGRHRPVDALFRSLADSHADSAIGVVLSGGDSDGSLGVQAIKHGGGINFAQDPESARFPSMPRNAIETGCIDFVLRPQQIAHELMRLGRHPFLHSLASSQLEVEDSAESANAEEEEKFRRVFRRLRTAYGVDFMHYKRSTLRRRLARRMALQKIEDLEEYVALVESDSAESEMLYQDFLIRVTTFFRDPEVFQKLAQDVLPRLCEGRSPREPIRIWVPGCATGEEVYSIAMAFVEYMGDHLSPVEIQIFGSDVSETAIDRARAGIYPDGIAHDLSETRLRRFFVKQENGQYRIAKSIRDLCIFARQDVTRDPPFSRLDLLSCRNLLIYLDATAQRRVMQIFHYALRPQGVLLLGPSESVGGVSDLFQLADKHHRLYVRKNTPGGAGLDLPPGRPPTHGQPPSVDRAHPVSVEVDSAQRAADRFLLARFAPASLLVDEALNILQFRGETGPYLEHASGPSSLNLTRVVRPELMVEIAPAIQEARESGTEARREGLDLDDLREVSIEVIPLNRMSTQRCYLILFGDSSRGPGSPRTPVDTVALPESEKDHRLAQFAREVGALRDYLQATMEEHEAVKEELQSAHEEVLSANEELQSANEELETAKEELQSANEELTTTNDELRNRNRELARVNAEVEKARADSEAAREYGDAIVEAIHEPLVVLDGELKVLRANQRFYELFKVRPDETVGRAFDELGSDRLTLAPSREQLESVLTQSTPVVAEEITCVLPQRGRRVMSMNARKIPGSGERPGLIVISMEDITESREYSDDLRERGRHKDEFLAMLAHELRSPLAPIRNAIHLLQNTDTAASLTELYEIIERQSQRLERIVDDLLDLARISHGIIPVELQPVDLVSVVRHALEACRIRIDQGQHELSLQLPDDPVCVHGDPVRLEQVVSNLVENAAKYTNPGGRIIVALRRENGEAVLTVSDNGIGLSAEMLERVFDLFTQGETTLAPSGGSLGVGLTLVRRLLELHGGRIEARSSGLGKGSEFIARLPTVPLTQITPQSGSGAETTASAARKRRVLIVDDHADSALSMALIVRSWGHQVAVARDGSEALGTAASFKPDCALVDIGLPGMDGYELARRFRQDPAHEDCYLVALTGYGREADVEAARAAGFDLHRVKPADLDELKRLLARDELKPHD